MRERPGGGRDFHLQEAGRKGKVSATRQYSCAHLSQRWALTSARDTKFWEPTAIDGCGESGSGCKAARDLQTQTLKHPQLILALAPLQQVKVKILKMKRQPGTGHKGVLGRASPPAKAEGGWWGHGTGEQWGGTTKPHHPPLHPSPECESSRLSGYLAEHQHPAPAYVAFSEMCVSLSSRAYKPLFQHYCCAGAS